MRPEKFGWLLKNTTLPNRTRASTLDQSLCIARFRLSRVVSLLWTPDFNDYLSIRTVRLPVGRFLRSVVRFPPT
jgi:hypothetical protein